MAMRAGLRPADLQPRQPGRASCRRSSPPRRARGRRRAVRYARRTAAVAATVAAAGLGWMALQRIGIHSISRAVMAATPDLGAARLRPHVPVDVPARRVLARVLRAALPGTRVRRRDAAARRR